MSGASASYGKQALLLYGTQEDDCTLLAARLLLLRSLSMYLSLWIIQTNDSKLHYHRALLFCQLKVEAPVQSCKEI